MGDAPLTLQLSVPTLLTVTATVNADPAGIWVGGAASYVARSVPAGAARALVPPQRSATAARTTRRGRNEPVLVTVTANICCAPPTTLATAGVAYVALHGPATATATSPVRTPVPENQVTPSSTTSKRSL